MTKGEIIVFFLAGMLIGFFLAFPIAGNEVERVGAAKQVCYPSKSNTIFEREGKYFSVCDDNRIMIINMPEE